VARLAREAQQQIARLIRHYASLQRHRAAELLNDAVEQALASVEDGRVRLRPHPAGYPIVAAYGLGWFKVHRYWFAATRTHQGWVITSVIFDSADVPRHVSTDLR
jgi:plasmid stabilization system protein ParE